MKFVTMTHPKLKDRKTRVPESAVRIHEKSGWQLEKDAKADGATTPEQPKPENG